MKELIECGSMMDGLQEKGKKLVKRWWIWRLVRWVSAGREVVM